MNKEILNEVDKIVDFIKETDTYKDYLFLKDKLSKNDKANSLIRKIKKNQQELVKKQVNKEDIKDLEDRINNDLEQLNKMPLYVEFIEKQQQLNEMYQEIKTKLDDYFYDKFN